MGEHITDNLFRSLYVPGAATLRAADDDTPDDGRLATLDIQFARFNHWNEIDSWFEGRFLERLSPGAFTRTMQHRSGRIVSLFNHGHDPQIGDKVIGGIDDMGERQDGPFLTVALDDTSYGRDLLPGLRRGNYGASYMFRVVQEAWDDDPGEAEHNPEGIPERTIKEVQLYEAGPVTFPADESTTIGVRGYLSETDRFNPEARAALMLHRARPAAPEAPDPAMSHSACASTLSLARARERAVAWAN